ncbi:MAG: DUF4468 domain-containing protein [Bacteroidia bacterium]|nr:DUF4468 domain-containing protein [Bacteroidia bacterium]
MKTISFVLTIFLLGISQIASAQGQDQNAPTYDYSYTDSTTNSNPSDSAVTDSSTSQIDNELASYKRIVLNFDSNTNLITYNGVVEQEDSGSDSLYARAKKFGEKIFGKDKNIFEVQKYGQKLIMNGSITAYSYANKYNKKSIGKYEFKFIILIKEGRYKYTITNLVHQGPVPANGKPYRNYFEYYYNSTSNIRGNDVILRYADREIKETIAKFQSSMKEPRLVDEDEW